MNNLLRPPISLLALLLIQLVGSYAHAEDAASPTPSQAEFESAATAATVGALAGAAAAAMRGLEQENLREFHGSIQPLGTRLTDQERITREIYDKGKISEEMLAKRLAHIRAGQNANAASGARRLGKATFWALGKYVTGGIAAFAIADSYYKLRRSNELVADENKAAAAGPSAASAAQ